MIKDLNEDQGDWNRGMQGSGLGREEVVKELWDKVQLLVLTSTVV